MNAFARVHDAVAVVADSLRPWSDRPTWREMSDSVLFETLVGCILGSRVPFATSVAALGALQRAGLLEPTHLPAGGSTLTWYEAVHKVLRSPLGDATSAGRYRFPHMASERLRVTVGRLEGSVAVLRTILNHSPTARHAREKLVLIARGLGPKQASLFLRNVGYSADLAVLDSHVLAYMQLLGLAESATAPSGLRRYEELEARLRAYAAGLGVPLGRLDLSIWIVMRVSRRVDA